MWSSIYMQHFRVVSCVIDPLVLPNIFTWVAERIPLGINFHVICIAALCWSLWKTRNNACFDKKLPSAPVELICYFCVFLRYCLTGQGCKKIGSRVFCWREPRRFKPRLSGYTMLPVDRQVVGCYASQRKGTTMMPRRIRWIRTTSEDLKLVLRSTILFWYHQFRFLLKTFVSDAAVLLCPLCQVLMNFCIALS